MNEETQLMVVSTVLPLAAAILTPLALWLGLLLRRKLGIDEEAAKKLIEGSNRDALNMALDTAATLAVAKGLIGRQAADFILNYLRQSSPEATAAAAPVLQEKIEAAVAKVATDEIGKLVKEFGGADKLRAAVETARKWTPKD